VKGITWNKKQSSWFCTIVSNKKAYFVGSFKDINQARSEITKARTNIHKEFANHG